MVNRVYGTVDRVQGGVRGDGIATRFFTNRLFPRPA
jgi:hypothetical protein